MKLKIISVLILFYFCASVNGSRILCYLQTPSKSHVMLGVPICETLAERGHQVVLVANYEFRKNTQNLTNIVVSIDGLGSDLKELMASGVNIFSWKFMKLASRYFRETAKYTLSSETVQKLLKKEKFDLVIFVNALLNNVHLGIADHFKAPWIGISPIGNVLPHRQFVGSPSLPSIVPSQFLGVKGTMSFKDRVLSHMFNVFEYIVTCIIDYNTKSDYEEFFPSNKYRSYEEMQKNNSLMLLNGHFADSGLLRPLLPNEIEVGGIQIKTKPTPLTGELKKFLDEAQDGAILWTFGSNIEISKIPSHDKVDIMLKVLGALKYRVVMKWEIDDIKRLPKNVYAQKWLPQGSILAHPNIKLFISHGGAGGMSEAKYHQVPILVAPFFGDQITNCKNIEEEGWGRSFALANITEKYFSKLLNDMLTNQKYRENVKVYSDNYRDRIASPLDTAIFWVEYVLKHHGAPHLRYPGKDLNFFQRHSLDVLGLFVIVLWVICKILKCLGKFCFRNCFKGKKDQNKKKTN